MFIDFSKAFDSIHSWSTYFEHNVTAIMILYKNTEAMVRSSYGDTDLIVIAAGVLQKDTFASFLFIICPDYVIQTSIDLIKENDFH